MVLRVNGMLIGGQSSSVSGHVPYYWSCEVGFIQSGKFLYCQTSGSGNFFIANRLERGFFLLPTVWNGEFLYCQPSGKGNFFTANRLERGISSLPTVWNGNFFTANRLEHLNALFCGDMSHRQHCDHER